MKIKTLLASAAALVVIGGLATPASATLAVRLNDPVSGPTITDGGVGDLNPLAGLIGFNINGVNLVISFGATANQLSPTVATIGVSGTGLAPASPNYSDEFTFYVSADGLTSPDGLVYLAETVGGLSNTVGAVHGSVDATGYYGPTGALFDLSGANTGLAATDTGIAAADSAASGVFTAVSPYSITECVHVKINSVDGGGGTFQASANLAAVQVPEPASVVLLGGVILLSTTLIRRKYSRV